MVELSCMTVFFLRQTSKMPSFRHFILKCHRWVELVRACLAKPTVAPSVPLG